MASAQLQRQDVQVQRFCRQYLQLEQHLDYPHSSFLREEQVQESLYESLLAGDALANPPPQRYQLRVLKELVARIEASIDDWDEHGVSDNLMSCLSALVSSPLPSEADAVQQKCFVTYSLSLLPPALPLPSLQLTLSESRSLISASGTTGLRTWEAALHLGQYLCAHPAFVAGRRVLELGAGTGYLSLLCAKYLGAARVIASDGSDHVINNLPENFFLNGLQGSNTISAMDMKWGHALSGTEEREWNGGDQVDVVLGADITYDGSVIPALVATLEELLRLCPAAQVLIAATERNRQTFEAFQRACSAAGFVINSVEHPVPSQDEQLGPFYPASSPIHICSLTRAAIG